MNRARRHFLAGAALAQNQHRSIGRSHLANGFEHRPHGGTAAEHPFKAVTLQQLLHLAKFLLELGNVETALQ